MTAYTPNLPALITALPGDDTRAPQTEFTRARQVLFLENLSVTGSVRSAACAGGVSHQTVYRARRACGAFRTAWDAALVVARASAADTLASRAIDGIEETVFYHGETVATRIRYSDRLLLAHLARLDRLVDDPRANAFAEDWEGAMQRFAAGAPNPEAPPPPVAENFSPGPCNTRSMSYEPDDLDAEIDEDEEWEEDDDGINWENEEEAYAEIDRITAAMAAERPADAPQLTGVGPDGEDCDPDGLNAEAQWEAYARKIPRWWLVVAPWPWMGRGRWHYHGEAAQDAPGGDFGTGEGPAR